MASITVFLETTNYTWHHDLALDSVYLLGHAAMRMYIFFNCLFVVPILNPQFDLELPFNGVSLHAAYSPYPSPSSPPSPSNETNPAEYSSSTSSSRGDHVVPELPSEGLGPVENGFHTP